jgi:hypothetical protein
MEYEIDVVANGGGGGVGVALSGLFLKMAKSTSTLP